MVIHFFEKSLQLTSGNEVTLLKVAALLYSCCSHAHTQGCLHGVLWSGYDLIEQDVFV